MTKRKRNTTSVLEPHQPQKEWPTPTKAKIQAVIEYNTAQGLPVIKRRIFVSSVYHRLLDIEL